MLEPYASGKLTLPEIPEGKKSIDSSQLTARKTVMGVNLSLLQLKDYTASEADDLP